MHGYPWHSPRHLTHLWQCSVIGQATQGDTSATVHAQQASKSYRQVKHGEGKGEGRELKDETDSSLVKTYFRMV